ncbi:hypothetical protein GCM10027059_01170 [Myceligenerans halotolerans]
MPHRRDQVAERLPGAGAGLDQQVLAGLDRLGHGPGHVVLSLAPTAAERTDGKVEKIVDLGNVGTGGGRVSGDGHGIDRTTSH